MGNYALVVVATGYVENIIAWDGPDAGTGWFPPEGEIAIQYTEETPVQIGWRYEDGKFIAPPPPVLPPPTREEIEQQRQDEKDRRMRDASIAMTPAFMALQLGNATDEETQTAKAWQEYYRELKAVDISDDDAQWPVKPA